MMSLLGAKFQRRTNWRPLLETTTVWLFFLAIAGLAAPAQAANITLNCTTAPQTSALSSLTVNNGTAFDSLAVSNLLGGDVVTINVTASTGGSRTASFALTSGTGTGPSPASIALTANAQTGSSVFTKTSAGAANFTVTNTSSENGNRVFTWTATCTRPTTLTITFPNPGAQTYSVGGTVGLTATASSGLAVTYASTTAGVCTVSGSTVTFVSAGSCSITASQAGNGTFSAAPNVSQTFTINQATQAIVFGANPGPVTYSSGGTFSVSATGGASGNAVTFSVPVTTTVCSVSGTTVTMLSVGTCTVAANQAGNTNYSAAPQVTQSITINQATQTISLSASPTTIANGGTSTLTLTDGPGTGAVTYGVTGPCTFVFPTLTATGAGSCVVTATKAADTNYASAMASATVTVKASAVAVGPPKLPNATAGGPFVATVVGSGGVGPYKFAVTAGALPPGLSLDANTGKITGTPSEAGNYAFTVTATDSLGAKGASAYTIAVQLDVKMIRKHTAEVLNNFSAHRADVLTSSEPDRARNFRRLNKSLFGGGATSSSGTGTSAPFNLGLSGSEDGGSQRFSFGTSLQQMYASKSRPAAATPSATDSGKIDNEKMSLGGPTSAYAAPSLNQNFDVWVEAHGTWFDAEKSDSSGRVGLFYGGADYLLTPGLLAGVMVQFDVMDESSIKLGSTVEGHGWLAGPYIAARLTPNLYFDARAEWGESTNTVSPFGTYTDKFSTDRWLTRADLTGNWEWDAWRFTPSIGVTYFEEKRDAYIDTNGISIKGATATLGRMTFGPEIGHRFTLDSGIVLEPFVSLQGVWDFDKDLAPFVNGVAAGTSEFRGKVQAGVTLLAPQSGTTVRATGSFDGLGDDSFKAYSGQLWINIPVN